MQTTLQTPTSFAGIGLHTGKAANLVIRPAPPNHGIVFRRTDIALGETRIEARFDLVETSPLCTRLVNEAGVAVSTVEHVMAALAGCGVHNALVEIDGPECPILDGSSAPFVRKILQAGVCAQSQPVQALEILQAVEVRDGSAWARLSPSDQAEMRFHIDFADAAIGTQTKRLRMANGAFVRELCDSRTFCSSADVEAMRASGKALGGTFENAVVFEGDKVLSPGGLRHKDEPVRHKMLDALGDLALAGAPIIGLYEGHKAGHALTNALLRRLFSIKGAARLITCDAAKAAQLPGAGVRLDEFPAVA